MKDGLGLFCDKCECDAEGPITCNKKCDCNAHEPKWTAQIFRSYGISK